MAARRRGRLNNRIDGFVHTATQRDLGDRFRQHAIGAEVAERADHERTQHESQERRGDQMTDTENDGRQAFHSAKTTLVPGRTSAASFCASQFVRRTQPCEAVLPTDAGSGVP